MATPNKNKTNKLLNYKVTVTKGELFPYSPYLEKKHEEAAQFLKKHGLPKELTKKWIRHILLLVELRIYFKHISR
jgi:hypothetical protein